MYARQSPLVFENVAFGYTRKPLLQSLSLEIGEGERVALIGSNGSGKTTIIRLALGLDVPRSGTIHILGKKTSLGSHFRNVGYIGDPAQSDDGLGLPLWLTVKDIVAAYRAILGPDMPEDFSKKMFDCLELSKLAYREIRVLSSGERRRLMTYLAVCKKPQLLIADEATEIVSKNDRPTILKCIAECCDTYGTALLWVSHDSDSTSQITNRVLILENGQVHTLPERNLLLTIERDSNNPVQQQTTERRALYQMRNMIEQGEYQRLHLVLERDADVKEYQ